MVFEGLRAGLSVLLTVIWCFVVVVSLFSKNSKNQKLDSFDVLAIFSIALLVAALAMLGLGGLAKLESYNNQAEKSRTEVQSGAHEIDRAALVQLPPLVKEPIIFETTQEPRDDLDTPIATPVRLAKSIDKTRPFMAEDIKIGFAMAEDFSGGRASLMHDSKIDPAKLVQAPHSKSGDIYTLRRNENFSDLLVRANIFGGNQSTIIDTLGQGVSLRKLQPGAKFVLTKKRAVIIPFKPGVDGEEFSTRKAKPYLAHLEYRPDRARTIELLRRSDGSYALTETASTLDKRYIAVAGDITDNLFNSAERVGMSREATASLANLFVYDIDFQREIFSGDNFEAVYEAFYNDRGELVKTGDILYGRMTWRGGRKSKGYYRFVENDKTDWFDAKGESARRFLMRTVIEGARITSRFGKRRHPISGYTKAHKGVDFGARRGTPVMAAGDGVIVRANRFSTYGNYVKIKHSNGFETAYAHLNGFAKGIRKGKRVRQGQIIAYVGSTGRSTGPHLHYEVLRRGKQVNPLKLKVADGKKLSGNSLESFAEERDWIERLRPALGQIQLAELR
jgi:murein DD-endopeptidase MepM/ murein hydrolase activator NlpD